MAKTKIVNSRLTPRQFSQLLKLARLLGTTRSDTIGKLIDSAAVTVPEIISVPHVKVDLPVEKPADEKVVA